MGGHWLALQSVALIGMYIENRREASFVEALEKTFDGNNPCSLCEVIEEGQKKEGEKQACDLLVKLNAVLPEVVVLPPLACSSLSYFGETRVPFSIALLLPTPPPWRA